MTQTLPVTLIEFLQHPSWCVISSFLSHLNQSLSFSFLLYPTLLVFFSSRLFIIPSVSPLSILLLNIPSKTLFFPYLRQSFCISTLYSSFHHPSCLSSLYPPLYRALCLCSLSLAFSTSFVSPLSILLFSSTPSILFLSSSSPFLLSLVFYFPTSNSLDSLYSKFFYSLIYLPLFHFLFLLSTYSHIVHVFPSFFSHFACLTPPPLFPPHFYISPLFHTEQY